MKTITNDSINKIAEELARYRLKNGRNWKSKLKTSFYRNVNLNPFLKRFMEMYSFCILDSIKNTTSIKEIKLILKD